MTLREDLKTNGFAFHRRALDAQQLATLTALAPPSHAARNLLWEQPGLAATLQYLGLDRLAGEALGDDAFPVNVLYFDKTADVNWKVPGHQDLTIPVEREIDEPGFTGWSTKHGVVHVEPPAEVLDSLVILRVHLDDCPTTNGALAVVPGSHLRGKLGDAALAELPREAFVPCEAAAGDVLLMKPLLVHRSSAAEAPGHRRVLHVVYASDRPGKKIRWKRPPQPAPEPPVPVEAVQPEAAAKPKRRRPLVELLQTLMLIAMMLGGVGVILETWQKISSGRGGEIYFTMSGYRLSYMQAMVLIVLFPLVVIAGYLVAHWQRRDERDFERRYPAKPCAK